MTSMKIDKRTLISYRVVNQLIQKRRKLLYTLAFVCVLCNPDLKKISEILMLFSKKVRLSFG